MDHVADLIACYPTLSPCTEECGASDFDADLRFRWRKTSSIGAVAAMLGMPIRIIGELVKGFAKQRRITKRACGDYAYTKTRYQHCEARMWSIDEQRHNIGAACRLGTDGYHFGGRKSRCICQSDPRWTDKSQNVDEEGKGIYARRLPYELGGDLRCLMRRQSAF